MQSLTYQRQQSTGGARVTRDARRVRGVLTFPLWGPVKPKSGKLSQRLGRPPLYTL